MAVAVDGDAIVLARPGPDGRLEIAHKVIGLDQPGTQSGISSKRPRPAVSPSKGAPISTMSKIHSARRDRLLQARVIVGLRQVDPVDLGAGIGLPRLEEATEQEVVQVLVVHPMKVSSTPANSPSATVALVPPRQSSPPAANARPSGCPCRRRGSAGSPRAHRPAPSRAARPASPDRPPRPNRRRWPRIEAACAAVSPALDGIIVKFDFHSRPP